MRTPVFKRSPAAVAIIICVVTCVILLPFLGAIPLFDWDEVNFAEAAREMILTGDYARVYIDFIPFWEKPPLFFWLQAGAMQIFGIGDFAARFPNVICGALTLGVLYLMGNRMKGHRFGILWVLAYAGSILPQMYFRSGIIDPWFNLFIFLSIATLARIATSEGNARILVAGGILMGLAVLTKGPVAYLLIVLTIAGYWIVRRFRSTLRLVHVAGYTLIGCVVFGLWYGFEIAQHGPWFVQAFTQYQIDLLTAPGAGHAGFPGYHIIVLLIGCFPASVLALQPMFSTKEVPLQMRDFRIWMIVLFAVVLVVFTIVESKIVHYSSLCYFPLSFFAATYLSTIPEGKGLGSWQKIGVVGIGLIYIVAGVALVYFGLHTDQLIALVDDFDTKQSLRMDPGWQWWHAFPVVFMLGALVVIHLRSLPAYLSGALLLIFSGTFIYLGVDFWFGKVQTYSQGPSTAFFQSFAGKDVYAVTWGHKSYSPYWDFRKPLPADFSTDLTDPDSVSYRPYSNPEFLLTSPEVRKPVYVITKASKAEAFQQQFPLARKTGEDGGFVFFQYLPGVR